MNLRIGFTLIELLVVISIITLLSSIIFSSISSARDQAKGVKYLKEIDEIKKSMESFYAIEGYYPDRSPAGTTNDVIGLDGGGNVMRYSIGNCSSTSSLQTQLQNAGWYPSGFTSNPDDGLCYEFVRHDVQGGFTYLPDHEYVIYVSNEELANFAESDIDDCYQVLGYTAPFYQNIYPHLFCFGVPYHGGYQGGE